MGLGSVISQTVIEKRSLNAIDWSRVTRFAAFGYLISVDLFFRRNHTFQKSTFISVRDHFFDIGIME
jgi:hypothetical protein